MLLLVILVEEVAAVVEAEEYPGLHQLQEHYLLSVAHMLMEQ